MSFWESVASAGVSALGSIIGSGLESAGASSANQQNIDLARENREWQERMSNTRHQRETEDLEKAGLNRILSLSGGGASVPTPNTAKVENKFARQREQAVAIANSIASIKHLEQQVNLDKQKQVTEKHKSTRELFEAEKAGLETVLKRFDTDFLMKNAWMRKAGLFQQNVVSGKGIATGAVGATALGKGRSLLKMMKGR